NPVNNVDPGGLKYYHNRQTKEIRWFDNDPGDGWEDYTDHQATITQGGCFATDRCVVNGDSVTFRENGDIVYHNRDSGAAIVTTIGTAIQETFLRSTYTAAGELSLELRPFSPTTDAPTTIDLPTAEPGGPLEPI